MFHALVQLFATLHLWKLFRATIAGTMGDGVVNFRLACLMDNEMCTDLYHPITADAVLAEPVFFECCTSATEFTDDLLDFFDDMTQGGYVLVFLLTQSHHAM